MLMQIWKGYELLTNELINDCVVDVTPVVPVDQHLPLHVQEVDGAAGHPYQMPAPLAGVHF